MPPDTFAPCELDRLLLAMRELAGELSLAALLPKVARVALAQVEAAHCRVLLRSAHGMQERAASGYADDTAQSLQLQLQLELIHQGSTLGLLQLAPAPPAREFTARQQRLAQWIAAHATQALANAMAHEQLASVAQDLRTSQELLKQGERFNHTGSMRYLVREDTMVCSDELCRIYGLPAGTDRISYEDFSSLMHPDDRRMVLETVEAAVAIGGTIRVQHRICRRDSGEVRYISGIGKPVWVDGSFTEYMGTATDITLQRQAEHAMRLAQADLARVARATTVGQLTASIAHEINQPLMSIVSNAGASLRWLERDPPQLDNARAGLRDIVAEGQRAGGIVAGLQGLTRNAEPVFKRLDLNDTIGHVLALLRSELERREVILHLSLIPFNAWVLGDAVQLQQVMLNLVANAIDAMANVQGRARVLSIATEAAEAADATDSTDAARQQRIVTHVRDSGEGIAAQAMPRVFEAFYTTKENGMGMGLAICRSIVDAHQGRLTVSAAQPCGTVFSFALPRVP